MSGPRPPVEAELEWREALLFDASVGVTRLALDGDGRAGLSPVQALILALAGCMASDVAHILARGRFQLRRLGARIVARRAEGDPHRVVAVELRFSVEGDAPEERVARAIALSREKYCSVWHSLREDIAFETAFEVKPWIS